MSIVCSLVLSILVRRNVFHENLYHSMSWIWRVYPSSLHELLFFQVPPGQEELMMPSVYRCTNFDYV